MGIYQVTTLVLGVTTTLLIPLIVMLIRAVMRWTRMESRLETLANDMRRLVEDKDNTHRAMVETMKDDRNATNRRLEWLEQNLWKRG